MFLKPFFRICFKLSIHALLGLLSIITALSITTELNAALDNNRQSHCDDCNTITLTKSDTLKKIALDFLELLDDINSSFTVAPNDPRLESLIADNFTLTNNGITLSAANGRELYFLLVKDSSSENSKVDLNHVRITPSAETNTFVAEFNLDSYTIIMIARCNPDMKIYQVNIVAAFVETH